jgi:sugar phosphate isomerase/epimerase
VPTPAEGRVAPDAISIQLFTVREPLERDLDATLERLAEIGFRRIEHAGVPAGLTTEAFRRRLDACGLRATSGHMWGFDPLADPATWEPHFDTAETLGQRYVVLSAVGIRGWDPQLGVDAFDRAEEWLPFLDRVNEAGARARARGLRLVLHNHAWEFAALRAGPKSGFDLLLERTDPAFVELEVDLYWAWYAHHDPAQIVRFAGPRVRQLHVKDMRLDAGTMTFEDPGRGIIDFGRVFAEVDQPSETEFIIERDDAGAGALETARVGYEFLRTIRFRPPDTAA